MLFDLSGGKLLWASQGNMRSIILFIPMEEIFSSSKMVEWLG